MLKSLEKKSVTYVGYTKDIKNRIRLHNSGKGAKFTRGRKWKVIYKEKLTSKNKAISREYYIKKNRTFRNKIKKQKMKISILLPYKENFSPSYPGAVSLFVNDTVNVSRFKKNITVYGNTEFKKTFKCKYHNIPLSKLRFVSQSKRYIKEVF